MRRIASLACGMLAACGPTSEGDNDTAFNIAAVATVSSSAAPGPAVASPQDGGQDSGAKPAPGALRTFGDWTVGCDNGLTCQMGSLFPEEIFDGLVAMSVARDAGEPGAITIAASPREDNVVPSAIVVDGKRIAGTAADGRVTGAEAQAVVRAIANGTTLDVIGKAGKIGSVSLKGAAAALRYIDAAQGRAGTQGAVVAKGARPDVAKAPMLPVILAAKPDGPATPPSAAQLATMTARAQCEMPEGVDAKPDVAALGGGRTLVILPCSAGAYNVIGALFVIDGDRVTPAAVDAPSGFEETGADSQTPVHSVVNGDFGHGLLSSYAKGRGLGDCGVSQEFVWDGKRFRLSRQMEMGECRGNIEYITTWRAKVVRR